MWDALLGGYVYETASGTQRVTVDSLRGEAFDWRDLTVVAERQHRSAGIGTGAKPGLPSDELTRAENDFLRQWCDEPGLVRFRLAGLWTYFQDSGAASGRHTTAWADEVSGKVWRVLDFRCPARSLPTPTVPSAQAIALARAALPSLPHVRSVLRVDSCASSFALPSPFGVGLDATPDVTGVQRLIYSLYGVVSPTRMVQADYDRMSTAERRECTYTVTLSLDARTGEVYAPYEDSGSRFGRVGHEALAGTAIGDAEVTLNFPIRMRSETPYVFVGYLQSAIWRGQVEADGGRAKITYKGRPWQVTADSPEVLVDGKHRRFAHPPLVIQDYLYLPSDMIEAITGWHIEYVKKDNTVYLYTHLKGEKPPGDK
jgi:hypothetical protein